jgi:hypothetical protein
MIKIENLTEHQVELLDAMWSIDKEDEYLEWYESLNDSDRRMSDVLMKLILHELIDESMISEFSDAKKVLKKFML